MKTQNLLAMALTIALTFVAAAMFFWQSGSVLDTQPHSSTTSGGEVPSTRQETPQSTETRPASQPPVVSSTPQRVHLNCNNGYTAERDASGNSRGLLCNPSAYENYSTEALESLAYGDAEAASVLAYRIRNTDYPRALKMALRSVALSGGETGTLVSATNWRPLIQENGDPSLSGYGQAYVLHSLISRLKTGGRNGPPTFEMRLRELADDPEAALQKLDAIVDRMYEELQQIERDVTGYSRIGGQDDA